MTATDIRQTLWPLIQRSFNRELTLKNWNTGEIAEWDSLTHINLIFEIEDQYGIQLTPDEIATLYSNTDTIIKFLENKTG